MGVALGGKWGVEPSGAMTTTPNAHHVPKGWARPARIAVVEAV
jgi:hypothetical protein